jgi:methylated-DNA-[protein]-cysteine S-methyltransferase
MSCGGVSAIVLLVFLMHLGAKSCFPHTPSATTPRLSKVLRGTANACFIPDSTTPCSAASDRAAFRLPPRPEISILPTPSDKSNCSLPFLTPFQERVFEALDNVQAGSVTTYKRLAGAIGCKSAQAIGQALKRNPRAPRIPCHRVISESRCIGGYSGKTDGPAVAEKWALLVSEGITFDAKGRAHHIIAMATDKRASPATTEKQEVPSLLAATRCPTYAHLRAQREFCFKTHRHRH